MAPLNIPVLPAPGVHGLAPRLSIDYGGGRPRQLADEDRPGDTLGHGWRLGGVSAIRMCARGQPDGDDEHRSLCLDGEPLALVAGRHLADGAEYRTWRESYARVAVRAAGSGLSFEARLPDGGLRRYGGTADSRVRPPAGLRDLVWLVDRETDAFGNAMAWEYHADRAAGVHVPKRVVYGDGGDAEVLFRYAARVDEQRSTQERRAQRLLLHTVETRLAGRPVREYRLPSETANGWRRLSKLQLCAFDQRGAGRRRLAAMDFDWIETDHPTIYRTCLSGVADPLGAATAFGYATLRASGTHPFLFEEKPFGAFPPPADARPHPAEADGRVKPVVAALRRDDGRGGSRRLDYAYQGRPYDGGRNWGFLGFPATRVTDRASGIVVYRQFHLDLPHAARLAAEHRYLGRYAPGAGNAISRVEVGTGFRWRKCRRWPSSTSTSAAGSTYFDSTTIPRTGRNGLIR